MPRSAKAPTDPKSGRKSGNATAFKPGADPRRGKGPAKAAPNAGRPPDAFKAELAAMGSRQELLETVARVLNDPTHPAWPKMVALVWDRGYGKPAQSVDVTSDGQAVVFSLGIGTA